MEIVRAWADQAHVATKNVQDLGQFIDPRLAQDSAERSHPVCFERVVGAACHLCDRQHCTQLQRHEGAAIAPHAGLHIEKRARVEERVQQQNHTRNGRHQGKERERKHHVKPPFHREVEAPIVLTRARLRFRNGNGRIKIKHDYPQGSQVTQR